MQNLSDEYMNIENFFYKILYCRYFEENEFENSVKEFKLNNFNCFATVRIEIYNKKRRTSDIFHLIKLVKDKLTFCRNVVIPENETKIAILCITDKDNEGKFLGDIHTEILGLKDSVKNETGDEIIAGISLTSDQTELESFKCILKQSDKALYDNFCICNNDIYQYKKLDIYQWDYNFEKLNIDVKELLSDSTPQKTEIFLETYCPEDKEVERNNICIFCASVYAILQNQLAKRNINFSKSSGNINDIWESYNGITAARDYKKWLSDFLCNITKLIRRQEMQNHEQLISEITDYIKHNFRNISGIEQIASHFYISTSYVRKIYKKYTGNTIFDVLFERRMEEAKKLLKNPDSKVYEVAEQVGYKGKRYFINAFHEHTGCSPKEYQLKYSEKNSDSKW